METTATVIAVVPLHSITLPGQQDAGLTVACSGTSTNETVGISVNRQTHARIERGPFGISDEIVRAPGCLAGQCPVDCRIGVHGHRVPQIQIRKFGCQSGRIRQAIGLVILGIFGDIGSVLNTGQD